MHTFRSMDIYLKDSTTNYIKVDFSQFHKIGIKEHNIKGLTHEVVLTHSKHNPDVENNEELLSEVKY